MLELTRNNSRIRLAHAIGSIQATVAVALVVVACGGSASLHATSASNAPSTAAPSLAAAGASAPQPNPNEEFQAYLVRCLGSFGFAAHPVDDAVFVPEASDASQREALANAQSDCYKEAVDSGVVVEQDLSDPTTLRQLYHELMEAQACLSENGYAVAEPPSQTSFVESGGNWNPYFTLSTADAIRGVEVCPSDYYRHLNLRDRGS